MNVERQINMGIWVHNSSPCPEAATIAATGLGRSGTTMLARVLSELGLYVGTKITPMSHEDKDIQLLIKERNFQGFERLCRERDEEHLKWGFKCPALRAELADLCHLMRSPRLIVVFRDLLAISIRNNIAIQSEVVETLVRSAKGYQAMVEQISLCSAPTLMISYEKALQFPDVTVRAIAEFSNLSQEKETIDRAALIIRNGDEKYLRE